MIMRRRPLLRAAAFAGTGYLAGKHAAGRQERQYQDNQSHTRTGTTETHRAAPSITDQLTRLSQLHQSGALTDKEFTEAKASLLGISD